MDMRSKPSWPFVAFPAAVLVSLFGVAEAMGHYSAIAEGNNRAVMALEEEPNSYKLVLSYRGKTIAERSGFSDKLTMEQLAQDFIRTGKVGPIQEAKLYDPATSGAFTCQTGNRYARVRYVTSSDDSKTLKLQAVFTRAEKTVYTAREGAGFADIAEKAQKFCDLGAMPS